LEPERRIHSCDFVEHERQRRGVPAIGRLRLNDLASVADEEAAVREEQKSTGGIG